MLGPERAVILFHLGALSVHDVSENVKCICELCLATYSFSSTRNCFVSTDEDASSHVFLDMLLIAAKSSVITRIHPYVTTLDFKVVEALRISSNICAALVLSVFALGVTNEEFRC